jgi:hypothetical protein
MMFRRTGASGRFRTPVFAAVVAREVLPFSGGCGPEGAGWNGGQRARTLVRTTAIRVAV